MHETGTVNLISGDTPGVFELIQPLIDHASGHVFVVWEQSRS
jgi:hypothetical protein